MRHWILAGLLIGGPATALAQSGQAYYTDAQAARGQALFKKHCSACHFAEPDPEKAKHETAGYMLAKVKVPSNLGGSYIVREVATNAEIAPSLGRNLAAGATATTTVQLIPPGQVYGPRVNQVDLRVSRQFQAGRTRIKGLLDIYNVGNVNTVLVWNNTYGRDGAAWQRPTLIISGRIFKIGGQIDF
jgi:hypothetical protein